MKTALVIGGSGLVGTELVDLLLKDSNYEKVILFGRKTLNISNPKLKEHIIDFEHPDKWKELVRGDVLFSTLGTTLGKAGGKEPQYKVDYTYQYEFAKAASGNGVSDYVLVSSIGANASSMFFYTKMKGELEDAVNELPFSKVIIIRPTQLDGNRTEKRMGEKVGLVVARFLTKIGLLGKRQPIQARDVARAMIQSVNKNTPHVVYAYDELRSLAKEYDKKLV